MAWWAADKGLMRFKICIGHITTFKLTGEIISYQCFDGKSDEKWDIPVSSQAPQSSSTSVLLRWWPSVIRRGFGSHPLQVKRHFNREACKRGDFNPILSLMSLNEANFRKLTIQDIYLWSFWHISDSINHPSPAHGYFLYFGRYHFCGVCLKQVVSCTQDVLRF